MQNRPDYTYFVQSWDKFLSEDVRIIVAPEDKPKKLAKWPTLQKVYVHSAEVCNKQATRASRPILKERVAI
jgi:hypothetical protein